MQEASISQRSDRRPQTRRPPVSIGDTDVTGVGCKVTPVKMVKLLEPIDIREQSGPPDACAAIRIIFWTEGEVLCVE